MFLLVTFGASALGAALSAADMILSPEGIAAHRVTLNAPVLRIAGLDIGRNLVYAAHLAAFAGLAIVLLAKDGIPPARIGLRWSGRDLAAGAGLAALIGIPGLALYLAAHSSGFAPAVAPASDYPLWRMPELVVLAFANGLAEEVVVVGYLLTRLRQLGLAPAAALCASALLRGGYHLYQGLPAGAGNVAMGLVFGWAWLRWRRLTPLIAAHTLIDSAAFVGYPLLHGHLAWLP